MTLGDREKDGRGVRQGVFEVEDGECVGRSSKGQSRHNEI